MKTTTEERAALLAICDNAVGPFRLELGKTIAALLADLSESEERVKELERALSEKAKPEGAVGQHDADSLPSVTHGNARIAELEAREKVLVIALTEWTELARRIGENHSDAFERTAEKFYRDTGYIAPGKSVPLEMGHDSYDKAREAAWEKWSIERTLRLWKLRDLALAESPTPSAGEKERA